MRRVVTVEGQVVERHANARPGYGAYGAGPVPLNDQERAFVGAKMNATVAAVRAAFATAQTRVTATPNSLVGTLLAVITLGQSTRVLDSSPTETKTSVKNALTTLERGFEQQVVAAMPRVYSGELTSDRWFGMVQTYVTGIKSILASLQEDGTAASMQVMIEGMARDSADFLAKFKAGVERTFDLMPVILFAVGAVAAYTLVTQLTEPARLLLPQRKQLNGVSTPRSRRKRS